MSDYRNVLKARAGLPLSNYYDSLWGKQISPPVWKTITGVLPLTFTATGGTAVDWVIEGNQQGVGERTENIIDVYSDSYGNKMPIADGLKFDFSATPQCIIINGQSNGAYPQVQICGKSGVLQLENGKTYTGSIRTINKPEGSYVYMLIQALDAEGNWTNLKRLISDSIDARFSVLKDYVNYRYLFVCENLGITYDDMKAYFMVVEGSTPPTTYIPYGYQIPLTVSQTGQTDKNYDIYIGNSPLTEGETVSKTSTGVDIELFEGENVVSTTLYNKPAMEIKYK